MEKRLRAEAATKTAPRYFQCEFGDNFEDTRVSEVDPYANWHDLVIWDEPKTGRGVRYVIGVDPAYGANEHGDHASIEVFRAYSDKATQVAEFVRRELPTYKLAWAVLHLAGTYNSETMLNVELQGGGFAVMEELQRLQQQVSAKGAYDPVLARHFENMRHYVYSRPDAVRRSQGSFHWRTTPDSRERMLATFRDFFEQGIMDIRSLELIKEIESIQRLKDGSIETGKENHRLMAACVATMAYVQLLETDIGGTEFTETHFKEEQKAEDGQVTAAEVLSANILEWRARVFELDSQAQALKKKPRWMR
jgi:hypothetical protein